MSKPKAKFYTVLKGRVPGVYNTWEECKAQVDGFANPVYKSFESFEEAKMALEKGYLPKPKPGTTASRSKLFPSTKPMTEALVVDAACSKNPGPVEYRGVHHPSGTQIFHKGPFEMGTNNLGEFLAIVHGLAMLKAKGSKLPIYSDSATAIAWVKNKKIRTELVRTARNAPLWELIDRAVAWLQNNTYETRVIKWETEAWGEIPADFGRK